MTPDKAGLSGVLGVLAIDLLQAMEKNFQELWWIADTLNPNPFYLGVGRIRVWIKA